MSRLHETDYPINDLLLRRWSPRAFDPKRMVSHETLRSLLEAARWAPSCFNDQPWHYIVATKENPAEFDRMLACLVEKNQQWAKTAPVLMISVARHDFAANGNRNRHAMHDVGAASAMLTIEATARDLYVHQMAGFSVEKARETYNIPNTMEPAAAIALGHLGDPNELPEDVRARELVPGKRKPMSDFVFTESWGHKPEWTKK